MPAHIRITVGDLVFSARMEEQAAPTTCVAFLKLLPYHEKIIQARWSGEAAWIPLGDYKFGVHWENAISYPSPGEILLYPGGISETEILFPFALFPDDFRRRLESRSLRRSFLR